MTSAISTSAPAAYGSTPTQGLLGTFMGDRLRLTVRGVKESTAGELAALPGVASLEIADLDRELATFVISVRPGQTEAVQRAVAAYTLDAGLILAANAPEQADLDSVRHRPATGHAPMCPCPVEVDELAPRESGSSGLHGPR
jgi:hypothetical protein